MKIIGTGHPLAGQEVSWAMHRKAEAGFLVGPPKLGYLARRTPRGTEAVPDPETAPLVARAFVEVAANGLSLRQVTRLLRELGLRGRRGKPVSLPTVQRMLADPYYAEGPCPIIPSALLGATRQRIDGARSVGR